MKTVSPVALHSRRVAYLLCTGLALAQVAFPGGVASAGPGPPLTTPRDQLARALRCYGPIKTGGILQRHLSPRGAAGQGAESSLSDASLLARDSR